MLPCIFPLFGCLVGHLESISTLRRKLLLFIRNFLKTISCCPLPFPRKAYCSITTHIKFKCRDMFTVRAVAQIGWAVAILLQSRFPKGCIMQKSSCVSHDYLLVKVLDYVSRLFLQRNYLCGFWRGADCCASASPFWEADM